MRLSETVLERKLLGRVRNPIYYTGGELNLPSVDFEKGKVRLLLSFPDLYPVGMSNHGWQILYHIVNRSGRFTAERVFAVPEDVERILTKENIPLYSLETKTPVSEFDVIGFSLSHELLFTSMLQILKLGGIPLRSEDRRGFPIIIAGGPGVANPEPIAPFVDAAFIGDGEEAILEILEVVYEGKKYGASREEIIEELSKIEGIYVPSFFKPVITNGRFSGYQYLKSDYRKVRRRLVTDLNEVFFPSEQITPLVQVVHDRFTVEIARGCVRSCRFCQAGMIYRPVRERNIDEILKIIQDGVRKTGIGDISFLSLSVGDYTRIEELVREVMDWAEGENVSLSFPSIRIDTFSRDIVEQIKRVRKTGFTIAPETGTDRLRRVINKYWKNEDVLKTAEIVSQAGWRLIKLYFMIGLPTETDEDREGIVELVKNVKKVIKNVNASVAVFVPKPHTPFQWETFLGIEEGREILKKLGREIRRSGAGFKWHLPEMSFIETVLGRGDRRLADVVEYVFENGGRLDSWNEYFKFDLWLEGFEKSGLNPELFASEIPEDLSLPWDHIDYGILKKFLKRERKKAKEEQETPFCFTGDCSACGVCDFKRIYNVVSEEKKIHLKKIEKPLYFKKILISYRRKGVYRYISSKELSRDWGIFLRKAGIKIKYTEGFHPLPKLSFIFPAPVGVASEEELVEVWVDARLSSGEVVSAMEEILPEEFKPVRARDDTFISEKDVAGFLYEVNFYDETDLSQAVEKFMERSVIEWRRVKKGKVKVKNLKEYVEVVDYDLTRFLFKLLIKKDGSIPVSIVLEEGFGISEPFTKGEIVRKKILLKGVDIEKTGN